MAEPALKKRVDRLEEALTALMEQTRRTSAEVSSLSREMKAFKEESRSSMEAFKEEMRASKKELDKVWADLARKMGTIAEDIVAPGLPHLLKRVYGLEVTEMCVRRRKRVGGKEREYDILAVAGEWLFVVEVKSTFQRRDVERLVQALEALPTYFPEYNGLRPVGVAASFSLTEEVVTWATRLGFLAVALSGDYLDLQNLNDLPFLAARPSDSES